MKAKRILITLAVVLSMLCFAVVDANAVWKSNCQVLQVGPSGVKDVMAALSR